MSFKRRTSRRDFLKGRSLADAVGDITHGITSPDDDKLPRPEQVSADEVASRDVLPPSPLVMKLGRRAMGCEFEVIIDPRRSPLAAEAAEQALDLMDELESQLSVYRDDSEISRINRTAAAEPVAVESHLFDLLGYAAMLCDQTGGAFDVTAGALTEVWGFFRRQGRMPTDVDLADAMKKVGSQWLALNVVEQTISFSREGLLINLGAIGKGYALDRCAELLIEKGVADAMLHGGQSSLLALGNRFADAAATPGWVVGLRHPMRPRTRLGEVRLLNQAMGTSGAGYQFFTHQGKRFGHILDPRSGRPAEGVLSASVVAPNAATADALATAFYVMGLEATQAYCERHPEIGAVLCTPGTHRGAIHVATIGMREGNWEQLCD
jgi:thiamine biosynthesis lipoprotein